MSVEDIKAQASQYTQEAQTAYSSVLQDLRQQAETSRERTRASALLASTGTYSAYAPALGEVKEAIKYEKRRKHLPGYGTQLEPLRQERARLKTEREVGRAGIRTEEGQLLAEIAEAESKDETELAAQLSAQLREISKWETEAVTAQLAHETEVARIEAELAPYESDGGYDIGRMLEDGYTVSELVALGFQRTAIKDTQNAIAQQDALEAELAPYEEEEGKYDLGRMLEDGYTESQLIGLGFSKEGIKSTKADIAAYEAELSKLTPSQQKEVREDIAAGGTGQYTVILPPEEQFKKAKEEGTIPLDATYIGPHVEGGVWYSVPGTTESKAVYQITTPTAILEISADVWDKLSIYDQARVVYGHEPTLSEIESYASSIATKPPFSEGAAGYGGIFQLPILGSFLTSTRLGVELVLPGIQSQYEAWWSGTLPVRQQALKEWYTKVVGVQPTFGGLTGAQLFPAIPAKYSPTVKFEKIPTMEWVQTGFSAAVIAAPFIGKAWSIWGAPRVVKVPSLLVKGEPLITGLTRQSIFKTTPWKTLYTSGGRSLITLSKISVRLPFARVTEGFYKYPVGINPKFPVSFSWGRGLQRAGLSAGIENAAFRAGAAAKELAAARAAMKNVPAVGGKFSVAGALKDPGFELRGLSPTSLQWGKVSSRLQAAQQASKVADLKLAEVLSGTPVTMKGLRLLEGVTGIKGIRSAIKTVSKAQSNLSKAWTKTESTKFGSPAYIKTLKNLQKAQTQMELATSKFTDVLTPRFQYGPIAGWNKVINQTYRELNRAVRELERAELRFRDHPIQRNKETLAEWRGEVEALGSKLKGYRTAAAAGEYPPMVTSYKMQWITKLEGELPEGPRPGGGFGKGNLLTESQYRAEQGISRASKEAYDSKVATQMQAFRDQVAKEKAMQQAWREHKWEPGGPSTVQEAVNLDKARLGLQTEGVGPKLRVAVAEPTAQLGLLESTAPFKLPTISTLKTSSIYAQLGIEPMMPTVKVPSLIGKGLVPTMVPFGVMAQKEFKAMITQGFASLETSGFAQIKKGLTIGTTTAIPEWAPVPRTQLQEEVELVPGWALTEAEVKAGVSPIAARQLAAQKFLSKQKVLAQQKFPYKALWQAPEQMLQNVSSLQNETLIRIRNLTGLDPFTQGATSSLTETQLQTKTQVGTRTLTTTKLGIKTRIPIRPPLIPPGSGAGGKTEEKEMPPDSARWQMGVMRKVIPPPYSGIKPYSEYHRVPKGEGSPYDTFVPSSVIAGEVDLGVTDIKFDKEIEFSGRGGKTNVGERDPSPYRGMTIRRKKQPVSLRM